MLGLRTYILKVSDLERAKDWYSKAFNSSPYFDQPFYVGFNIGGYELGLDPNGYDMSVKGQNGCVYWGVDNIQQEYERLIELGATAHEDPQNVGGEIQVAVVLDPWENQIGLIFNPEFKIE